MRATALLLVLVLLPGCLVGPGHAPAEPVPALDLMAEDVSALGQERAQRRAGTEPDPAGRQPARPPAAEDGRAGESSFLADLLDEALVDDGAYLGELLDGFGP